MNRLMASGVLKVPYALVAIADILVLGGFYGPALLGGNLRPVPGFEDTLPFAALALLGSSIFLILILLIRTVRSKILRGTYMRICASLMLIYAIIAGIGFGRIFLGDI